MRTDQASGDILLAAVSWNRAMLRRVFLKDPPTAFFAFVFAIANGKDFEVGCGKSLVVEAEFFRGAWREVEVSAWDEWAAVVDTHFYGFAVFYVRDFDEARQGKSFMSSDQMPWLHLFAQ